MDLISLLEMRNDGYAIMKYLESHSSDKIVCKFCQCDQYHYMKNRDRLRCKLCKKDFRPFNKSRFSSLKISYSKWLVLVKLFELAVSARVAAKQARLSYNTTLKSFDIFRSVILMQLNDEYRTLKGKIEADESYFGGKRKGKRGRGAGNKTIVFGILQRGGKVRVDIVPDVTAKTLLESTIKKVKKGSMIYTDKWKGYDTLIFHGYDRESVNHQKIFAKGDVHINGMEGFWGFAKLNLAKYRGVSSKKFLLYLKEMEWRYNNRECDLFDLLVQYMLRGSK